MKTRCSHCGAELTVPAEKLGKFVKCGRCGKPFCVREHVPPAAPAEPTESAGTAAPQAEASAPPRRRLPARPVRRTGAVSSSVAMDMGKELASLRKIGIGIFGWDSLLDPSGCLISLLFLPIVIVAAIPASIAKGILVGKCEQLVRAKLAEGNVAEARELIKNCKFSVVLWTVLSVLAIGGAVAVFFATRK